MDGIRMSKLRDAAQAVVNEVKISTDANPALRISTHLINELYAALAEDEWIPVSERLPEELIKLLKETNAI